jgi:flavin-dependent dehydrogenase
VDPFTGVGILPGVMSGALAAEAVHRALVRDEEALAGYSARIQEAWGSEMVWARRLARAFYLAPSLSFRIAVKREGAFRAIGRILCGEASYAALAQRALPLLSRPWAR